MPVGSEDVWMDGLTTMVVGVVDAVMAPLVTSVWYVFDAES